MPKLYHMVRGIEINVPGAITHIGPLQTAALGQWGELDSVPYIPWMNAHRCVTGLKTKTPPYLPDVESITDYVSEVFLDETGNPISDFCYLDIEGVPHPDLGWQPNYGEVYRDCIRVVDTIMRWKAGQTKLFIYWNRHGTFKRDQSPSHLWHGLIEPYEDAFNLTCYGAKNKAVPGNWDATLAANIEWTGRMSDWYTIEYMRGRPRVFFVWGYHNNMGMWPPDYWRQYMKHVISLCRYNDVICWFGAAKHTWTDNAYGPQIEILKELIEHDSQTPQEEPNTPQVPRVRVQDTGEATRQRISPFPA